MADGNGGKASKTTSRYEVECCRTLDGSGPAQGFGSGVQGFGIWGSLFGVQGQRCTAVSRTAGIMQHHVLLSLHALRAEPCVSPQPTPSLPGWSCITRALAHDVQP